MSQLSKHSPQGTQLGKVPVVPRSHRSHLAPVTPFSQLHLPCEKNEITDDDDENAYNDGNDEGNGEENDQPNDKDNDGDLEGSKRCGKVETST